MSLRVIFISDKTNSGLTSSILSLAFFLKKEKVQFGFIKPLSYVIEKSFDFDISSQIMYMCFDIPILKSFNIKLIRKKKYKKDNYLLNFLNYYNKYFLKFKVVIIEGCVSNTNLIYNYWLNRIIIKKFNTKIIFLVSLNYYFCFLNLKSRINFFYIFFNLNKNDNFIGIIINNLQFNINCFLKINKILINSFYFSKLQNFIINKIKINFRKKKKIVNFIPFFYELNNISFLIFIKYFKINLFFYYKNLDFNINFFVFIKSITFKCLLLLRKKNTLLISSGSDIFIFIRNYKLFFSKNNIIILLVLKNLFKKKFLNFFKLLQKKYFCNFFIVYKKINLYQLTLFLNNFIKLELDNLQNIKKICFFYNKYLNFNFLKV